MDPYIEQRECSNLIDPFRMPSSHVIPYSGPKASPQLPPPRSETLFYLVRLKPAESATVSFSMYHTMPRLVADLECHGIFYSRLDNYQSMLAVHFRNSVCEQVRLDKPNTL